MLTQISYYMNSWKVYYVSHSTEQICIKDGLNLIDGNDFKAK